MSKDYKKLYNELKKNLKNELEVIKDSLPEKDNRYDFFDRVESEGQIMLLEHLFTEYLPELEGKKWGNVFLNKKEFKQWKKEINAK